MLIGSLFTAGTSAGWSVTIVIIAHELSSVRLRGVLCAVCISPLGDFLFCKNSRPPARMISDGFEVKNKVKTKQRKVPVRDSNPYLKIPAEMELFFSPAHPLDLTPRVRREWKEKSTAQIYEF